MNDDSPPTAPTQRPEMPEIALASNDVREALRLAQATYERNRDRSDYSYRNDLKTHQVGKLGEFGAEAWLRGQEVSVRAICRDLERENECDLQTDRHRIEVKTWSPRFWEVWGRCVTPKQLPWIMKKAEIVLWTTAEQTDERASILIHGWNSPQEVGSFPPHNTGPEWKPVFNHQVPLDRMCVPEMLLTILKQLP